MHIGNWGEANRQQSDEQEGICWGASPGAMQAGCTAAAAAGMPVATGSHAWLRVLSNTAAQLTKARGTCLTADNLPGWGRQANTRCTSAARSPVLGKQRGPAARHCRAPFAQGWVALPPTTSASRGHPCPSLPPPSAEPSSTIGSLPSITRVLSPALLALLPPPERPESSKLICDGSYH